jgi:hypothetical protein
VSKFLQFSTVRAMLLWNIITSYQKSNNICPLKYRC